MPPEVCERIKSNRKRIGLTQEELGHALGVQKSAIQKYESGATSVKLDTLAKMSEVFGVSVATLLGEQMSEQNIVEVLYERYEGTGVEMFSLFEKLSPEGRLKVLTYAQDIHHSYEKE